MLSVHTDSKTFSTDWDRQRAIGQVLKASTGVTRLMPVIHRGKIIAWVASERLPSNRRYWIEHKPWMDRSIDSNGYLFGYVSVDDIIANITNNGQLFSQHWAKTWEISAMATTWSHLFTTKGCPAPGTLNGTAKTAENHSDSETGCLPHGGNVSTKTKHLLSATVRNLDVTGTPVNNPTVMVMYDMVLTYDNCDISVITNQSMTNTNTAARYIGAGDPGLQVMGVETAATTGNGTLTTVHYTSISGSTGQTIPNLSTVNIFTNIFNPASFNATIPWPTAFNLAPSGSTTFLGLLSLGLNAGDSGVQKIEDFTFTGAQVGKLAFILGYQLAYFTLSAGDWAYPYDFVKVTPSLVKIKDGACLTMAVWNQTANTNGMSAMLHFGWA